MNKNSAMNCLVAHRFHTTRITSESHTISPPNSISSHAPAIMTFCFSEQFDGLNTIISTSGRKTTTNLSKLSRYRPHLTLQILKSLTRAGKFRNVIRVVTGRKLTKKPGEKSEEM